MRISDWSSDVCSSDLLEQALIEGLTASGVDVIRVGMGPTPMLYYAEATLEVDGGIQITGSHNPAEYNGFKLVLQHKTFFGDDIQKLGPMTATGDWAGGAGEVWSGGDRKGVVAGRRVIARLA